MSEPRVFVVIVKHSGRGLSSPLGLITDDIRKALGMVVNAKAHGIRFDDVTHGARITYAPLSEAGSQTIQHPLLVSFRWKNDRLEPEWEEETIKEFGVVVLAELRGMLEYDSVWIDELSSLNLKIYKRDGVWYSSETGAPYMPPK